MKLASVVAVVVVGCGGGESPPDDGGNEPPLGCTATGGGTVNGMIDDIAIAPVMRANLFVGTSVTIVIDEVAGACGAPAETGEHVVLFLCDAGSPGTFSVGPVDRFACPASPATSLVESMGGQDEAEAVGGSIELVSVEPGCVTGSFTINYLANGGPSQPLSGSFAAVTCGS